MCVLYVYIYIHMNGCCDPYGHKQPDFQGSAPFGAPLAPPRRGQSWPGLGRSGTRGRRRCLGRMPDATAILLKYYYYKNLEYAPGTIYACGPSSLGVRVAGQSY